MKKIVIAAGTGFLGQVLCDFFKPKVKQIIVLTRGAAKKEANVHYVHWDGYTLGDWVAQVDEAEAWINMAGKSVDCRYNEANMKAILASRLQSTQVLGEAWKQCTHPPKVWLNSSTATIYKGAFHQEMDEDTGILGDGFSVNVGKQWEATFFAQETPKTRKVALRTAIVLGKKGGALQPLVQLVKFGMGGKQGPGTQKFSWIHEIDFARSIDHIIRTPELQGVVNIAAPKPTTNATLMRVLRRALHVPFGIPLPKPMLALGARMIKTETELILKSRNVIPKRLLAHQFEFLNADLEIAILTLT